MWCRGNEKVDGFLLICIWICIWKWWCVDVDKSSMTITTVFVEYTYFYENDIFTE